MVQMPSPLAPFRPDGSHVVSTLMVAGSTAATRLIGLEAVRSDGLLQLLVPS